MTGVRFPIDLSNKIEKWARDQPDKPNKAEAIRRLVEQALGQASHRKPNSRKVQRASDKSMPLEEQERRKRAVIRGPKEFRDIRTDVPTGGKRGK